MRKEFLLILLLFVCHQSAMAQRERVDFKTRGAAPLRKFEYHQPSNFEVVNGKFNASLSATNGYLFEIVGLPAKLIKCRAKFTANQFKVVLIDGLLDKTYVSNQNSRGTLRINCLPDGSFELMYLGEIFKENLKVNVSATLVGTINHSRELKTTK